MELLALHDESHAETEYLGWKLLGWVGQSVLW